MDERANARESLQRALVCVDRTRTPETTADTPLSALLGGMADGRWSLLDHFDCEGRRYLLVCPTTANGTSAMRLSSRERQVMVLASQGSSDKQIGYSLGLSTSTVSTYLARARKKLARATELAMTSKAPAG